MSKRNRTEFPVFFCGKVVFEFYNNDDENLKRRSLTSLCKELRKDFNVSATAIEENFLENPERGTVIFSIASTSKALGKEHADKVLKFLDSHAIGRIISDNLIDCEME